jgi:hypothetical protein
LARVLYDEQEQRSLLAPFFQEVLTTVEARWSELLPRLRKWQFLTSVDNFEESDWKEAHYDFGFFGLTAGVFGHLYRLKNPRFSEEREWRLLSFLGASVWQTRSEFLSRRDALVPYRKVRLKDMSDRVISEVMIGPKNKTSTGALRQYLRARGLTDVEVRKSAATYR